jgi:hypothetical protein
LLLLGAGVVIFITEFWRDSEGRGALFGGALNGPQCAAILLVVAGGFVLLERKGPVEGRGFSSGMRDLDSNAEIALAGIASVGEEPESFQAVEK